MITYKDSKVGDRVEVTSSPYFITGLVGLIGTISAISRKSKFVRVDFDYPATIQYKDMGPQIVKGFSFRIKDLSPYTNNEKQYE